MKDTAVVVVLPITRRQALVSAVVFAFLALSAVHTHPTFNIDISVNPCVCAIYVVLSIFLHDRRPQERNVSIRADYLVMLASEAVGQQIQIKIAGSNHRFSFAINTARLSESRPTLATGVGIIRNWILIRFNTDYGQL